MARDEVEARREDFTRAPEVPWAKHHSCCRCKVHRTGDGGLCMVCIGQGAVDAPGLTWREPPPAPAAVTPGRQALRDLWTGTIAPALQAEARTHRSDNAIARERIAQDKARDAAYSAALAAMDPRERFPVGAIFTHPNDPGTRHTVKGHSLLADGGCALLREDGYLSRASECEPVAVAARTAP